MRFILFKLRNFKLTLNIEERFKTDCIIIPIGYDCHPAYLLNTLKLRTKSLPLDWLNMDPIDGLQYVAENMKTSFSHFLSDLKANEQGHVISSSYPSTEFMHEKDLIENQETKDKLIRRYERFNKLFKEERCEFLYNIPSYCLKNEENVIQFTNHALAFLKLIKNKDRLSIYIRYDENYDENRINCDKLYSSLNSINRISIQKYIREKEAFGIWGDQKKYLNFFKTIHKELKRSFPKIYFS